MLGAFSIAAMHALIPSHWLAFAIVGRSQHWATRRTLTIAALAGSGHILLTIVLGLILAAMGKELHRAIPPQLEHGATAGLLIALGVYFLWPSLRGRKDAQAHHRHLGKDHGHHNEPSPDGHPTGSFARRIAGTPTVMGALVLGLTLSPCLDMLSVYVAASSLTWPVLIAISAIMAVTTLTIMLLLIWLTLHGLQRLKLTWLDQNEGLVVGVVLVLLGILLFFL